LITLQFSLSSTLSSIIERIYASKKKIFFIKVLDLMQNLINLLSFLRKKLTSKDRTFSFLLGKIIFEKTGQKAMIELDYLTLRKSLKNSDFSQFS